MDSTNEPQLPFLLSRRDARTLYRAAREHRKKLQRAKAKSDFVPEEGRGDVALLAIERAADVEQRLREFLGRFE